MKVLDQKESEAWWLLRGMKTGGAGDLAYSSGAQSSIEWDLPTDGLAIVGMTNRLSRLLDLDKAHPKTLLWLSAFDIWGEMHEAVGVCMWKLLLRGSGVQRPEPSIWRGLIFDESEVEEQRSFLTVVLTFQWDAYLIPGHGEYFVEISHDGKIRVAFRNAQRKGAFQDV